MFDTDALPCVGDLERTSAIKARQPHINFAVFVSLEPLPKTKDDSKVRYKFNSDSQNGPPILQAS